jgi:glycosyltransferase involved in cell wall biosynthesis
VTQRTDPSARSRRVAVAIESFGIGGREKVVAVMAQALNEFGIVPEILTLDPPASKGDLLAAFDLDARFEFKRLPNLLPDFASGVRAPYLNLMTRWLQSRYSWFLNLTGSLALCGTRRPVFHYVSVPERYIVLEHQSEGGGATGLRALRRSLHVRLVRQFDAPKQGQYIACNCNHTRDLFSAMHPGMEAIILYHPVDTGRFVSDRPRRRQILNVGRYGIAKRQLDLIALAGQLPDYRVICVGPGGESDYYKRCADYVRTHRLSNVDLLPAVPAPDLKRLMEESLFYVHLFKHEPFGIATAEAIAAGCLPVVPDAWGNREIVCIPELRFNDPVEIVQRIRLLEKDPAAIAAYAERLRTHVRRYDTAEFKKGFLRWIEPVLANPFVASCRSRPGSLESGSFPSATRRSRRQPCK